MTDGQTQPIVTSDGNLADHIHVRGITGTGYHGVLAQERLDGQDFSADVVMYVDTSAAAESDALMQTVNYAEVASAVHAVITGPPVDLIETLAAKIADVVLVHPSVLAVDVTVHKPQAPIEVPFKDVAIKIHRTAARLRQEKQEEAPTSQPSVPEANLQANPQANPPAIPPGASAQAPRKSDILDIRPTMPVISIIALGANLEGPLETLRQAVYDLHSRTDIEVLNVSPLAQTAPVGGPEGQPDFYNAVAQIRTTLSPRQLLGICHDIENLHGRVRDVTWGPRTLDLDIITYADLVAVAPDLEIPHPRAHQRAFVLQPWARMDPQALLPGLGGGPVNQLAQTAPDAAGIRWFNATWMTPQGSPPAP